MYFCVLNKMSDSEYSSEEDDEDYVPDGDLSGSGEECNEGENEESKAKKMDPKKQNAAKRKRKGGIKLDDDEESDQSDKEEEDLDAIEAEEKRKMKAEREEAAKKAHVEDLWSSFKNDTQGVRLKPTTASSSTKESKDTKPSSSTSAKKVTITKTYDFAGESVTVTKLVEAESSEARKAQKEETTAMAAKAQKPLSNPPINTLLSGSKRKGGLGSVLGQIGKKPKMNTLEKSKLDWDSFKAEQGIEEDLKHYNKDGYLEKQDFLQRTDVRLFEREREARMGTQRK